MHWVLPMTKVRWTSVADEDDDDVGPYHVVYSCSRMFHVVLFSPPAMVSHLAHPERLTLNRHNLTWTMMMNRHC